MSVMEAATNCFVYMVDPKGRLVCYGNGNGYVMCDKSLAVNDHKPKGDMVDPVAHKRFPKYGGVLQVIDLGREPKLSWYVDYEDKGPVSLFMELCAMEQLECLLKGEQYGA